MTAHFCITYTFTRGYHFLQRRTLFWQDVPSFTRCTFLWHDLEQTKATVGVSRSGSFLELIGSAVTRASDVPVPCGRRLSRCFNFST